MCDILVVEDNDNLRDSIKEVLELYDYSVVMKPNGLEAWDFIKTSSPSLIITDFSMPMLDGQQLIKLVQSNIPSPPPIILMSAYYRVDWPSLGAMTFLEKPFHLKTLMLQVERVFKNQLHLHQLTI